MRPSPTWVTSRFLEFYATLDTGKVLSYEDVLEAKSSGREFQVSTSELEALASRIEEELRGFDVSKLKDELSARIRSEPRYFLVLAHLFRQKKFTAAELVSFFFDVNRSSDIEYYKTLERNDPEFHRAVSKARRSYWIPPDREGSTATLELVAYKKGISAYLGDETKSWPYWASRIKCDGDVASRVAAYVIDHEGFAAAVRSGALVEILRHTLRATSSEDTKLDIGELGSFKVEQELRASGFSKPDCGHQKHAEIDELATCAKSSDTAVWYEREVKASDLDRRFDFALAGPSGVHYVVETNYYTSSGSKIDKTVKDFVTLEPRIRSRFPLIYVTDGIGWLGLLSLLEDLVALDTLRVAQGLPFLFNLSQFHDYLPTLRRTMRKPRELIAPPDSPGLGPGRDG